MSFVANGRKCHDARRLVTAGARLTISRTVAHMAHARSDYAVARGDR